MNVARSAAAQTRIQARASAMTARRSKLLDGANSDDVFRNNSKGAAVGLAQEIND